MRQARERERERSRGDYSTILTVEPEILILTEPESVLSLVLLPSSGFLLYRYDSNRSLDFERAQVPLRNS